MMKKLYIAPEVELIEIRVETGILSLSDGNGAQAHNVESMSSEDIIEGAAW